MVLINHSAFTVSEETFNIKLDDGKLVQYKQWHDSNGKLLETVIRDKQGNEIDDVTLLQKIWNLVDKKSAKKIKAVK